MMFMINKCFNSPTNQHAASSRHRQVNSWTIQLTDKE